MQQKYFQISQQIKHIIKKVNLWTCWEKIHGLITPWYSRILLTFYVVFFLKLIIKYFIFPWSIITVILFILFYMFCIYLTFFKSDDNLEKKLLTFIRLYIVSLIIALPFLILIYNLGELHDTEINLKIIGKQWYWNYQQANAFINFKTLWNKEYTIGAYLILENTLNAPEFRLFQTESLWNTLKGIELHEEISKKLAEQEIFQKMLNLYNSIKLDKNGCLDKITNISEYNAYWIFRFCIMDPEKLPIRLSSWMQNGKLTCSTGHYQPVCVQNHYNWCRIFYHILSDPRIKAMGIDWQSPNISKEYKASKIFEYYPEIINGYIKEQWVIMTFNNKACQYTYIRTLAQPQIFELSLEKIVNLVA